MNWCCFVTKREDAWSRREELDGFGLSRNVKIFSYGELVSATDDFKPENQIGYGGFGTVFKGILDSGIQIAVKVLSALSGQGLKEFLTEIDTISNIKHPNLVELIGCCIQGKNRILVYEFVQNGSLKSALRGSASRLVLDWSRRSEICIYTAIGLKFLHEESVPSIVHRDIKASNILLDGKFRPKIGDFGLAKLFPDGITHISTRVAGTTGYLAPEYAIGGRLTKKADVYSFGVLVLEIISGRSSSEARFPGVDRVLLEESWNLYEEGKLTELVDPHLGQYPEEEVLKYIKVALFCTQGAAKRRPSMSQVLDMLTTKVRINEVKLTRPGLIHEVLGISSNSNSTDQTGARLRVIRSFNGDFEETCATMSFSDIVPR